MTKFLSKADIIAASDLKRIEVDVPEWGGKVWVTSFSADAKDALEFKLYNMANKSGVGIRAAYVGISVVDEFGQRLFTDEESAILGTKSAGAVDRIFEKVSEVNRITPKDMEDLEKNSVAVPGDGLPSDSASS